MKYPSPNGGITNLDAWYHTNNTVAAYAYCTITTDSAATIKAYITSNNGAQVFCNGKQLLYNMQPGQKSATFLPLAMVTTRYWIKLPRSQAAWTFSFRLDEQVAVTSLKYKILSER